MKDVYVDYTDFYFDDILASDLSIKVAQNSNVFTYNMSPQIEDNTETVIGIDGALTVSRRYCPRVFTVPIIIKDMRRLREISAFFRSINDKKFCWNGDNIYLNCFVDTSIDMSYYLGYGRCNIKFRANDPYFYEVNPTRYIITKDKNAATYDFNWLMGEVQNKCSFYDFNENVIEFKNPTLSTIDIWNEGNVESSPLIKLYGDGDISMGINGNVCTITNVSEYVTIDIKYYTVLKDSINMLSNIDGLENFNSFNLLPGWNGISFSDNVTKVEILPRSRWI